MIMVELYHWNLHFSLGIYLFIIKELKIVLQVLSVIYSPFLSQSSTVLELIANANIKDHVQFGDFKSSVKTYPLNLCFVYVVICVSV